jgi:DNA-binding LacI/PurR family transcriptional regulator
VERILAAGPPPEAIVAVNDLTALGVIAALEEGGVRVPEGCRVTGYDDSTLAAIPRISLTSVDPHNRRIGREAAEALLSASESVQRGREVLIPPSLVVRESSGA